jgi:hypothetical protein
MIEFPVLKTTPSNRLLDDGCDMADKKESPDKKKKNPSEQNYYILLNEEKLKAKEAEKLK